MTGAQRASLQGDALSVALRILQLLLIFPGYSAAVLGTLGNSYRLSAFAPAYEKHSQSAGENVEYWLSRVSGWSPV